MIPHVVLHLAYNEKNNGVPEFVIKALYVEQWCSDTIS